MIVTRATRRRNPAATTLRDAVVLLAVLAIGTTVQVSYNRTPEDLDAAARPSSIAAHPEHRPTRPAAVDSERWRIVTEEAGAPSVASRERTRANAAPEGSRSEDGPQGDPRVTVEVLPIATRTFRLWSADRS